MESLPINVILPGTFGIFYHEKTMQRFATGGQGSCIVLVVVKEKESAEKEKEKEYEWYMMAHILSAKLSQMKKKIVTPVSLDGAKEYLGEEVMQYIKEGSVCKILTGDSPGDSTKSAEEAIRELWKSYSKEVDVEKIETKKADYMVDRKLNIIECYPKWRAIVERAKEIDPNKATEINKFVGSGSDEKKLIKNIEVSTELSGVIL